MRQTIARVGVLFVVLTGCQNDGGASVQPTAGSADSTTARTPTNSQVTDSQELMEALRVQSVLETEPAYAIVTQSLAELVATSDAVLQASVRGLELGRGHPDAPELRPVVARLEITKVYFDPRRLVSNADVIDYANNSVVNEERERLEHPEGMPPPAPEDELILFVDEFSDFPASAGVGVFAPVDPSSQARLDGSLNQVSLSGETDLAKKYSAVDHVRFVEELEKAIQVVEAGEQQPAEDPRYSTVPPTLVPGEAHEIAAIGDAGGETWRLWGKTNDSGFCYSFTTGPYTETDDACVPWTAVLRDQVLVHRGLPEGEVYAAIAVTEGVVTLNEQPLAPVPLGDVLRGVPSDLQLFVGKFEIEPAPSSSTDTTVPSAADQFVIVPSD